MLNIRAVERELAAMIDVWTKGGPSPVRGIVGEHIHDIDSGTLCLCPDVSGVSIKTFLKQVTDPYWVRGQLGHEPLMIASANSYEFIMCRDNDFEAYNLEDEQSVEEEHCIIVFDVPRLTFGAVPVAPAPSPAPASKPGGVWF